MIPLRIAEVTARIVVVAKLGETDERVIANATLLYLRAFLPLKHCVEEGHQPHRSLLVLPRARCWIKV